MDSIHKLEKLFGEFPGIGPRQAKRFVYFLLTRNEAYIKDVLKTISDVKRETRNCRSCFRFFPQDAAKSEQCQICRDASRDQTSLMIVSRDVDLENIEKSHAFNGRYFVLGGSVPILEKAPESKVRSRELISYMNKQVEHGLKEIILAVNFTPEGENTAEYIQSAIKPLIDKHALKISTLGKGLSTGTELEYSDGETIKNALRHREATQ